MILISMTDFVLEQYKNAPLEDYDSVSINFINKIIIYAEFLKQPLELWMFVPCDEKGRVLEKQNCEYFDKSISCSCLGQTALNCMYKNTEYERAEERVLFDGFEYCESQSNGLKMNLNLFVSPYTKDGRIYLTKKTEDSFRTWFQLFTIEDLVQCDLQLTESAIKQLGL